MYKLLLLPITMSLLLVMTYHAYSQSAIDQMIPKVAPSAPTTASLNRFEDYKLNLYTGIPDISIPLYTIEVGEFSIPIVLRYHASGIKITDRAGWVGLGWSLDTGPTLARRIMGIPDESENGFLQRPFRESSSFNTYDINDLQYLNNIKRGHYDNQADVFSYSLPGGKSGKFFFNRQQGVYSAAMIPYSPIDISFDYSRQTGSGNLSFTITDEYGNIFYLGHSERETSSTQIGGNNSLYGVTAWKIEKIQLANKNDFIIYKYANADQQSISENTEYISVSDNVNNAQGIVYVPSPGAIVNVQNNSTLRELNEHYIEFPNGRVVFERNTGNREDLTNLKSLSAIKVYRLNHIKQYVLIKEIRFDYSYFNQGNILSSRLRLNGIKFYGESNEFINEQKFEYKEDISLPVYTSWMKDYWGYYNGKSNNSLIPRMQIPYNAQQIWVGSNLANGREPDSNFMQAFVLKRISHQTGGYTEFEYQTNRYTEENNAIKLAGGLRISKIRTFNTSTSVPITRTFTYGPGRRNFHLNSYYFQRDQTHYTIGGSAQSILATKRVRTFFASPTVDIVPYDGSAVSYPIVTEILGEGTSNTGKIEYVFQDRGDAYTGASATGLPVINSYFYQRGNILSKTEYRYDRSNNQFKPIRVTTNTYTAFPDTMHYNVGLVVSKRVTVDPSDGIANPNQYSFESSSWVYSNVSLTSGDSYLTSTIEKQIDDSGSETMVTTNYDYHNFKHQQINRISRSRSDGSLEINHVSYPLDYRAGTVFIDSMIRAKLIAYPIEQVSLTQRGNNVQVTNGHIAKYQTNGYALKTEEILFDNAAPLALNNFKFSNRVKGVLPDKNQNMATLFGQDPLYKTILSYSTYDDNRKLAQYSMLNAPSTSYIWGYNGQYPIAEVKNTIRTDIAHTSFEEDGKGNWTYSGSVNNATVRTGKLAYVLNSSSPISKSGLSSARTYVVSFWTRGAVLPRVNTTVVTASHFTGSLNGWNNYRVQVSNVSSISVNTTSTTGIIIDDLGLHPLDAEMTTYTYDPLVGMTSETDSSGRTVYYDYDGAGRLQQVRDAEGNITDHYQYNYRNQ